MTSATLLASLAVQQRRIVGIVDGLDDAAMRRPVLPSGWSCAGMLRHLTVMTRFWFVEVVSGHPAAASDDDDFAVPAGLSVPEIVTAYRCQASQALALVADMPLGAPLAWWPEGRWGGWRLTTLEQVLLHVQVELACHAGHLDAVRELIDGRTWDYGQGRLIEAAHARPQ